MNEDQKCSRGENRQNRRHRIGVKIKDENSVWPLEIGGERRQEGVIELGMVSHGHIDIETGELKPGAERETAGIGTDPGGNLLAEGELQAEMSVYRGGTGRTWAA